MVLNPWFVTSIFVDPILQMLNFDIIFDIMVGMKCKKMTHLFLFVVANYPISQKSHLRMHQSPDNFL